MPGAKTTTDHSVIQSWVQKRNGQPARVRGSGTGGLLRIDFGEPEDELDPISWEQFFHVFEHSGLAFLYQEANEDGRISRFNKFIDREANARTG